MAEQRTPIQHLVPTALVAAAASKPIVIELAWYIDYYKVLAIDNTTILKPGEWLSVAAVDQINGTPGWTAKITDNALIQTLFGLGTEVATDAVKAAAV